MKKNHNISALVTLAAGAVTVLCCLVNGVPILNTLKYLLIVLILFLIIGRIVEHIIFKINEAAKRAAVEAEEEARRLAKEQEEAMMREMALGEEVTEDGEGEEETEEV